MASAPITRSSSAINTISDESYNIISGGTGAGGSNTNENGLTWEEKTSLDSEIESSEVHDKLGNLVVKFKGYRAKLIETEKYKFQQYTEKYKDPSVKPAHGCKQPDKVYINQSTKKMYVLEMKYQNKSGSVCEKLQTGVFKKQHYNKMFPSYQVEYIFVLNNWFRENCEAELEYLLPRIPIFWGEESTYKTNIISFMMEE